MAFRLERRYCKTPGRWDDLTLRAARASCSKRRMRCSSEEKDAGRILAAQKRRVEDGAPAISYSSTFGNHFPGDDRELGMPILERKKSKRQGSPPGFQAGFQSVLASHSMA